MFPNSFLFPYYNSVHGKTTDEWHMDDIRVHTRNIWMTCEYIRVTYRWIRVYTSDIRITFEYIELTFLKLFINSLSKYLVWIKIPWMQWLFCFGLITKLKRGLELALGEHLLHGFLYKCSLFNTHQFTKFQCHIFFTSQDLKQNVLLILI